jgi:chromosome segregation ATPase
MNSAHLIRHLAKASDVHGKHTEGKDVLSHQIKHMKDLVRSKSPSRNELQEGLLHLENQLQTVLDLENQLLKKDSADASSLHRELAELKQQLKLSGSGELHKRLSRIEFLMGELNSHVDAYTKVKEDRQRRMEELEVRIKSSVERNFKEIITIEKSIAALEGKYNELKDDGKADKQILMSIDDKLHELRQKIVDKKIEIVEKRKSEATKMVGFPVSTPPAKLSSIIRVPEPDDVMKDKGEVKHRMMFPPPISSEDVPEFPLKHDLNAGSSGRALSPPIPPPKKKGFFSWLWG